MAQNIYSLQLLRNGTPYTSYTEAVAGIQAAATQDGVLKLARYTQAGSDPYSGDTGGHIKTIFAFRHEVGGESGYTIYEDYKEVVDVIKAKIDSMTGEGSGSIYDQIMTELRKLDYSGVTTGDGVVVTNVTETDGVVSATSANVGGLKLTDYERGSNTDDVAATDTINQAFAKLQNQIDELSGSTDDAIEALDAVITAADGSYIDKVEQVDGKISGTTKELPTVAEISEAGKPIVAVSETKGAVSAATGTINAEFVNVADADNNFTASTVEAVLAEIKSGYTAADAALKTEILGSASASADTLGELETLINNLSADAKEYHIVKTTTGLPETIKERYSLVDADGNVSGDTVDIPKDSHIVSIAYDGTTQKLTYNYIDASGNTQSTDVDMSELVLETEFGSGVTVTNHVAHGVVDPTSEKDADNNSFLTVGADGFKVDGIKHAIDAAVSGASDELQDAIDELSGKAVTSIASADGSVTATPGQAADGTVSYDLSTDASKVKVSSAYTAGTDTAIATGDTVDAALAKLEAQIAAAKAAATVVEKDTNASHLTLTSTTGTSGEIIYTIGESDIASASALTAEIAARKAVDGVNGDAYTADTNAHYINNANSLYGADQALDTALYTVSGKTDAAQAEIDAIETAVGLNADGTYSPNTTNNYTSAATSVNGAIDALDDAVKANEDAIAQANQDAITGITVNGSGATVTDNVANINVVYDNNAANSTDGMVITTAADGDLTFQFGTIDAGTY